MKESGEEEPSVKRRRRSARAAVLLCLLFLSAGNLQAAGPEPPPRPADLVVGYSSNVFIDVDIAEAQVVTKAWSDRILQRKFRDGTAENIIFTNTDSIEKAVRERKVDLIALVSNDYLHLKERVPLQPVFVTASQGGFFHQIVLLVRRDSGIRKVGDLRRKQLAVSASQAKTLHMVWLETHLMRAGFLSAGEFFSSVKEVRRPSQAILPVFFRQADACLTTRESFELVCEMNPQVGKELMVLERSSDVAGGVLVFRPSYGEASKEKMMDVLGKLGNDPQGMQLLKLFRMSRLVPFRPEYLKTVEDLFRQHETLRVALAKGM